MNKQTRSSSRVHRTFHRVVRNTGSVYPSRLFVFHCYNSRVETGPVQSDTWPLQRRGPRCIDPLYHCTSTCSRPRGKFLRRTIVLATPSARSIPTSSLFSSIEGRFVSFAFIQLVSRFRRVWF